MSIITLRSNEDFGGSTASSDAAVNFQNHFEAPIRFNRDDQIQVTSITINQDLNRYLINNGNNRMQYRIGEAEAALGEIPFSNIHEIVLKNGSYTAAELAVEIRDRLNESITMGVYEFNVDYDAGTNRFDITMTQEALPGANNTSVNGDGTPAPQGLQAVELVKPDNLPRYPLQPQDVTNDNKYAVQFSALNPIPGTTPSTAEQLAQLQISNFNLNALQGYAGKSAVVNTPYKYRFRNGLFPNGGFVSYDTQPVFVLANIDLIGVGTGPGGVDQEFVQITNYLESGSDKIFKVAINAAADGDTMNDWRYKLLDTNEFVGKPEEVELQEPTSISGINSNNTNNTITNAGAGFTDGAAYQGVVLGKPGTELILSVSATAGAITAFKAVTPGDNIAIGDTITIGNGYPGITTPATIVIGTGGRRTTTSGINNPQGTLITEGDVYRVAFPNGSLAQQKQTPPLLSDIEQDAIDIDLKVRVDEIDPSTRAVTKVSFVSCGLESSDPNFNRLKNVLTNRDNNLVLEDNNNSFTSTSSTIVEITQRDTSGPDELYVGINWRTGLMGIGESDAVPTNPGNYFVDGFDMTFTPAALNLAGGKAGINHVVQPKRLDKETGEYAAGTKEMTLQRYEPSTGATGNLSVQPMFMRCAHQLKLARGELVHNASSSVLRGAADIQVILRPEFEIVRKDSSRGRVTPNWSAYNIEILTAEYDESDDLGKPTMRSEFTANILDDAGYIKDTDATFDKLQITIDDLNEMSITYSQSGGGSTFTPITYNIGDSGADRTLRESAYPLIPIFEFGNGYGMKEAVPSNKTVFGQQYSSIAGRFELDQQNKQSMNIALSTFHNPFPNQTLLEPPTGQPNFIAQSVNPALLQLALSTKFNQVLNEQIDNTTANPIPGTAGATSTSVGFTSVQPNNCNLGPTIGHPRATTTRPADLNPVIQQGTEDPNKSKQAPTLMVEFPEFNIQGYSGAAKDKHPIVAIIPTEEWSTGDVAGTLHYKPFFQLPIDVNLPEDRELYSLSCRLRNLDGSLASNLTNPTTITFYKNERPEKSMEKTMERVLQNRSEIQDHKISTNTNNYPRV